MGSGGCGRLLQLCSVSGREIDKNNIMPTNPSPIYPATSLTCRLTITVIYCGSEGYDCGYLWKSGCEFRSEFRVQVVVMVDVWVLGGEGGADLAWWGGIGSGE